MIEAIEVKLAAFREQEDQAKVEASQEAARLKKLLEICEIPETGSLARSLQNYQGVTLMDTLKMMSLVNTKQTTNIVSQIEKIDRELSNRIREQFNPDDPSGPPLRRNMTPAEELMLREDRSRLLVIMVQQHNQKLKEVSLEVEASKLNGGAGKKKRKPGFSPIEIESGGGDE